MNVSKLAINIADPAGTARENLLKVPYYRDIERIYNHLPDYHHLTARFGSGKALLYIFKHPGSQAFDLTVNWIRDSDFAYLIHAKLIVLDPPTDDAENAKFIMNRVYITDLGKLVLLQNGIIENGCE